MKKMKWMVLIIILTGVYSACESDKPDVVPPNIKLAGDSSVRQVLNAVWTEPGFRATDDVDGDITTKVVATAPDVNTTGIQHITYTAVDAAGNTTKLQRKVTVFNQAEFLIGNWAGEYVTPYPGNTKKAYVESISIVTTKNMAIIINDFAGFIVSKVEGTLVTEGVVDAPVIQFKGATVADGALTIKDAKVRNNTEITIEYNVGSVGGVLVLNKQTK